VEVQEQNILIYSDLKSSLELFLYNLGLEIKME